MRKASHVPLIPWDRATAEREAEREINEGVINYFIDQAERGETERVEEDEESESDE